MDKFKKFFQSLSYLQYPLNILALYFCFSPLRHGIMHLAENPSILLESYNKAFIFLGLAISFSTLQDTTTTQNELSKKVWEDPKKGKIAISIICFMVFLFLSYGIVGYFITENEMIKELSFGSLVLSIGLIGFLKTALEVFENHRKDKNTNEPQQA